MPEQEVLKFLRVELGISATVRLRSYVTHHTDIVQFEEFNKVIQLMGGMSDCENDLGHDFIYE
jgi:hypothetical protein